MTATLRAEAARELLRRRRARRDLLAFTEYTKPDYRPAWYHRVIADKLTQFADGHIKRLMLFVPPQFGKSELTSRKLSAFLLGRNPEEKIIACSYGASLANKMSKSIQGVMEGDAYARLFPGVSLGKKGSGVTRNANEFGVNGGGGHYVAAGVGGGITGVSMTCGIIDDPLKNRQDAESPAIQARVWDWYNEAFHTRATSDNTRILIVMTRWKVNDLAGRLLEQTREDPTLPKWEVIRFPAIAEDEPSCPEDPRKPGEALWPERFSIDYLLAAKKVMGSYAFSAIYQQSPSVREGNLFKLAGLSHPPLAASPSLVRNRVRYWDKGYSAKGDYTVGCRMSHTQEGLFVVEDVVRIREAPEARNRIIVATAHADDRLAGKKVPVFIEQPQGAGSETTATLVRMLQAEGIVAHAHFPRGDKTERADPFASAVNENNVRLVKGNWHSAFIAELVIYPAGENDDQVDSASACYNQLTQKQPFKIAVV